MSEADNNRFLFNYEINAKILQMRKESQENINNWHNHGNIPCDKCFFDFTKDYKCIKCYKITNNVEKYNVTYTPRLKNIFNNNYKYCNTYAIFNCCKDCKELLIDNQYIAGWDWWDIYDELLFRAFY